MRNKIAIFVLVLLALSLTSAYAGNTRRIGTAGAQELLIPIGSRGTAMGGAVVANISGLEAIHWNPAGLSSLSGTEAMFTYLPYIADIDVNFVGIGTTIEDFGSLAAGAKIVSIGDMEETTFDFPDGTGRVFSPSLSVISVTYSRMMTYQVQFGITSKLVYERVFEVSATGVAFDIGFMYQPGWQGLSLGLSIMNYGPTMKFSGDGFNRPLDGRQGAAEGSSFDLPSQFNFGVAYDAVQSERSVATLSGNFRSNNYSQDVWQGGLEFVYDDKYSLRAGYNYADQDEWLYGFSVGGGLVLDIGQTKLALEYAWNETETFDDNQFFTVKFLF